MIMTRDTSNGAQLLATACDFGPCIVAARDAIETSRRLPEDLTRDLARAGFFRIFLPAAYGGLDLTPMDGIAVFEELAKADPSSQRYPRELGITHQMIIHALSGSAKRDAAFESYNKALALQERLLRADPENFRLRRELAYTQMSMGTFLEWSGDMRGALDCYGKTLAIFEDLVRTDPRNAEARLSLAEAYNSFGYAQVESGSAGPAAPIAARTAEASRQRAETIIPAEKPSSAYLISR